MREKDTENMNSYITCTDAFLTLILKERLHFMTCYNNSLVYSSCRMKKEQKEDHSRQPLCTVTKIAQILTTSRNNIWKHYCEMTDFQEKVSQPYTISSVKNMALDKEVNLVCFLSSNCNAISKEQYCMYLTLWLSRIPWILYN